MRYFQGMALFISLFLLPVNAFAANETAARVSYLGPAGTYTEEAAQFWFQEGEELIPKENLPSFLRKILSAAPLRIISTR